MKITLHQNNSHTCTFRLHSYGVATPADVSLADSIQLEFQNEAGDKFTPITCDIAVDGADWTNGLVVADITTVASQPTGTYRWGLTVILNGETITWQDGDFEVVERPGYVSP